MEKFKKLGSTEIYKGRRVHLITEKIGLPNGKETVWELVKHVGAAAVVAVDDDGKILMVEQYRASCDDITLEIPAGTLDSATEDPKDCATRELEEETGYVSSEVSFLFKFYSSIGICDEVIHIYVAKNLKKTAQNLDEDEFVDIKHYDLDVLIDMIFEGKIIDNKTISSLLAYKQRLEVGKI